MKETARAVIAAMLGVILAVVLFAFVSSEPTHDDLEQRQEMMLDQLTYISCILLIPDVSRSPDNVAECQVDVGGN